MPKSKRLAPTPVMPEYYDDMLAQIMWNQEYPRGTSEKKKIGDEWVEVPIAPEHQYSEDKRGAKMLASKYEDQKLAGLLGSSRSRREGEKQGTYALARYPQLGIAMMQASQGLLPPGANGASIGLWMKEGELGADPYASLKRSEERKAWAARQAQLVGGW